MAVPATAISLSIRLLQLSKAGAATVGVQEKEPLVLLAATIFLLLTNSLTNTATETGIAGMGDLAFTPSGPLRTT